MEKVSRIKTGGRAPGVQNKVSREIRALAMLSAEAAVGTLAALLESENEAVRIQAAREILDRCCGKSVDSLQVQRFENADEQRGKPPRSMSHQSEVQLIGARRKDSA